MNKPTKFIITGKQIIEHPSDSNTSSDREAIDYTPDNQWGFGYTNLTIVNLTTKQSTPLSKNPDQFISFADNIQEAREEFWARWKLYIHRRFKKTWLPILNHN